jgi:uncharacterized membrane protein
MVKNIVVYFDYNVGLDAKTLMFITLWIIFGFKINIQFETSMKNT